MLMSNKIRALYTGLFRKHGEPKGQWSLWCKRPKIGLEKEEIFIEAILTQRTKWKNVELAMKNLRAAKIARLNDICKACGNDIARFAGLIKPSGFYSQKAGYLQGLAKFVLENYESIARMQKEPLAKLREELLALKGIGPETADSILLYALEKPVFVIDEYTKRIVRANSLCTDFSYAFLQKLFEESMPKNYALYQDFHALIVIEGKEERVCDSTSHPRTSDDENGSLMRNRGRV